jgi:hypothetical protein
VPTWEAGGGARLHEDASPTPPGGFASPTGEYTPPTAGFNSPSAGSARTQATGPEPSFDPFAGLFRDTPNEPGRPYGYDAGQPYPQDTGPAGGGQPPYPGPGQPGQPGQEEARPSRTRTIVIVAAVLVLLVGGGVGAWATLSPSGPTTVQPSGSQSNGPAPSSGPATTPPGGGIVAIAPGVAKSSTGTSVIAFLNSYFTAINDYNFQAYHALLDAKMQRAETAGDFDSGYRSVRDSDIVLTSIVPGSSQVVASMTFTSHQPVSNSPTHSSCTHWDTTLYLTPQGSSYVIGQPPSNYHAAYHAC